MPLDGQRKRAQSFDDSSNLRKKRKVDQASGFLQITSSQLSGTVRKHVQKRVDKGCKTGNQEEFEDGGKKEDKELGEEGDYKNKSHKEKEETKGTFEPNQIRNKDVISDEEAVRRAITRHRGISEQSLQNTREYFFPRLTEPVDLFLESREQVQYTPQTANNNPKQNHDATRVLTGCVIPQIRFSESYERFTGNQSDSNGSAVQIREPNEAILNEIYPQFTNTNELHFVQAVGGIYHQSRRFSDLQASPNLGSFVEFEYDDEEVGDELDDSDDSDESYEVDDSCFVLPPFFSNNPRSPLISLSSLQPVVGQMERLSTSDAISTLTQTERSASYILDTVESAANEEQVENPNTGLEDRFVSFVNTDNAIDEFSCHVSRFGVFIDLMEEESHYEGVSEQDNRSGQIRLHQGERHETEVQQVINQEPQTLSSANV